MLVMMMMNNKLNCGLKNNEEINKHCEKIKTRKPQMVETP